MSAKTRKFAAPRGMSRWLASEHGAPVSATIGLQEIVEALFRIPSATLRSRSTRACSAILPQGPLSAAFAPRTAASTIARSAS